MPRTSMVALYRELSKEWVNQAECYAGSPGFLQRVYADPLKTRTQFREIKPSLSSSGWGNAHKDSFIWL